MPSVVQTVLGDVKPDSLGRTLTHEHLCMEFNHFYRDPPSQLSDKFDSWSIENLGYLRQYPYSSRSNLLLNDDTARRAVLSDLKAYKKFGGGTIVENSVTGLNRDIGYCKKLSQESGVNIVAGTGYYISATQTASNLSLSVEKMYDHMLRELTEGCVTSPGEPLIKAGFIGEIASDWPLTDFECKVVKASAEVQAQVGCGVSFHPHRLVEAPFEIIRQYLEAGGAADKAVMSHLDRTLLSKESLEEFADMGTYCQFDLFGVEVSYYQLNVETDMPSDAQRIEKIRTLVNMGKLDKVLMSHDIHTKHRLADFGGHGYSHILNNVLPKMKIKGFSQEELDVITIQNPGRWLTIQKA